LGAVFEKRTKRFFAYTSINQIGFILVGLATGSVAGYRATAVYIFIYALMNLIVIGLFLHARRADGRELTFLTDFAPLLRQKPLYALALTVALFSMAGIPPLAGFYGKYYLLLHALEQELYLLVIVGLATSLLSAYYYIRFVKIIWFEDNDGRSVQVDLPLITEKLIFATEALLINF
jgi:NADH-quinone oxidoreductase subunit N